MKMNKILLIPLLLSITFISCSTSKKLENKLPKGVICDNNYHCEVADPFDANINVMKQCFKNQTPEVIKNYDGHSLILRSIHFDKDTAKSTLRYNSARSIAKYFDILSEIYSKKYHEDIKKFLKQFTFYKEENEISPDKIIKKIFIESDLSNLQNLGELDLENGKFITCGYFNINSYIERRFIKIMPSSFQKNINKLLDETDKEFNKYMKTNKEFSSGKAPVNIGNMFIQKYHSPSKKQINEALLRIQKEKPLIISFCKQAIFASERMASCSLINKTELTIVDLIELSYLPLLVAIDLRGSKISNISLLGNIKNIKKVYIMPEQKNEDEIDVLKMAIPDIEIIIEGEKELKRRDELNSKISAAEKTIKTLEKKKKRTRSRNKKKKYQKEIDTLKRRIKRAQPELKRLSEYLDRAEREKQKKELAKKAEREKQEKRRIPNLRLKIKVLEKSIESLEDKRYKTKDKEKITKIDKDIEMLENRIKETKDKIKELSKKK